MNWTNGSSFDMLRYIVYWVHEILVLTHMYTLVTLCAILGLITYLIRGK